MYNVCLQKEYDQISLSGDNRIDRIQTLPEEVLVTIFKNVILTKSQLEISECSKHFYNIIFRNNPALMMLRDLMKCAFKSKWFHVESKKSAYGMAAPIPSSNRFLLQPNYVKDNESQIENYVVTSLYYENVTPEFKSFVEETVDKESYKTDKKACERKLFFNLIKYTAEKKCFVVDIGVERIEKSDSLNVIRIKKREFSQHDSSDISQAVFHFSGVYCTQTIKDESVTSIFKTILKKNKMIVPRPTLKNSEELASKKKKQKKVKYEDIVHDDVIKDMDDLIKGYDELIKALSVKKEPVPVQKIIVEDDACRCTLL